MLEGGAGYGRRPRGRAGGDRDHVGARGKHVVDIRLPAELDLDLECRQAAALPIQIPCIAVVTWRPDGVPQLSTQVIGRLPQLDVMSALTGERSEFHAGRAATDHEDAAAVSYARPGTVEFPLVCGLTGAAERQSLDVSAADALVATHAGPYVGSPALSCLDE